MKFSSSLLLAFIGGAWPAAGFLLPPIMDQLPRKRVERTPMESYKKELCVSVVS